MDQKTKIQEQDIPDLLEKSQQYFESGDFENSLKLLESVLEYQQLKLRINDKQIFELIIKLAHRYICIEDYQKSLKYYLKCLSLKEEFDYLKENEQAILLMSIGNNYSKLEDYQLALQFLSRSKELLLKSSDLQINIIIGCFDNFIGVYDKLGDKQESLKQIKQQLEFVKQNDKENKKLIGYIKYQIASRYFELNNIQNGLEYLLEILEDNQQLQGIQEDKEIQVKDGDGQKLIQLKFNIADCYHLLEDYQNSLKYSLEIQEWVEKNDKENQLVLLNIAATLSKIYFSLEDYKSAINYFLKQLELNHILYNKVDSEVLMDLGKTYYEKEEPTLSVKYFTESIEEFKKEQCSENSMKIKECFKYIQLIFEMQNDSDNSLKYYIQEYKYLKKDFESNLIEISEILIKIGKIYTEKEDYENGLKYLNKSQTYLEYCDKEDDIVNDQILKVIRDIAECFYLKKEYENSLVNYQKILKTLLHKNEKDNTVFIFYVKNKISMNYYLLKDFQNSLQYYLENLNSLDDKNSDPLLLMNIGKCYYQLLDARLALDYFIQSLNIYCQQEKLDLERIKEGLSTIKLTYENLGEDQKYLEYEIQYAEFLELHEQDNKMELAECQKNIGLKYYRLNDYQNAIKYFQLSLKTRQLIKDEEQQKENQLQIYTAKKGLCNSYFGAGEYQMSLIYSLEALEWVEKYKKEDKEELLSLMIERVSLNYYQIDDFQNCLKYIYKSVSIQQEIGERDYNKQALLIFIIAKCHYQQDEYQEAFRFLKKSLKLYKKSTIKKVVTIQKIFKLIIFISEKLNDLENVQYYELQNLFL